MRRNLRLFNLTVLCMGVTLLISQWVSPVSAKTTPDDCPEDKPLVVDAFATFSNVADFGLDGHVWALDEGTQFIQIRQLGGNAYCVKRHDVGTFTTFAGVSPAGTGTVPAGVTGTIDGTVFLRINGIFSPSVPTTGFIGDFDAQCQQDGTCLGTPPRTSRLYFSKVNHLDFGSFTFVADGGACGTWFQTSSTSTGDIAC